MGLHARAAAKLVRVSSRFEAQIKLSTVNPSHVVDGKSILGILLLPSTIVIVFIKKRYCVNQHCIILKRSN